MKASSLAMAPTAACCSSEFEGNDASQPWSIPAWFSARSGTLPKSYEGKRCTWVRPAFARFSRCRTGTLPSHVNAAYLPRSASGVDSSSAEKSLTWSS